MSIGSCGLGSDGAIDEDNSGTVRDFLDESAGPESGLRDGLSAMRIMSRSQEVGAGVIGREEVRVPVFGQRSPGLRGNHRYVAMETSTCSSSPA